MVDHLEGRERAGAGLASGPRRAGALVRSARNAVAFRGVSGMGWREMLRQGREMHRESGLRWGQVLMAANTPVLLRAAMVDGRTDLGLMSSGQVTGLIDDLPSCAELIEGIMAEAGATLGRLDGVRKA
jgi:NAD(P)H-dependent flavin oxidoreductase YrpB (nitropropane dioxygenase family)